MNLRIDSKSARIRVSHHEATKLLAEGELLEPLALPGFGSMLRARCTDDADGLELMASGLDWIEARIPRNQLAELLQNGGVELKASAPVGASRVELRFEIDRFSLARKERPSSPRSRP